LYTASPPFVSCITPFGAVDLNPPTPPVGSVGSRPFFTHVAPVFFITADSALVDSLCFCIFLCRWGVVCILWPWLSGALCFFFSSDSNGGQRASYCGCRACAARAARPLPRMVRVLLRSQSRFHFYHACFLNKGRRQDFNVYGYPKACEFSGFHSIANVRSIVHYQCIVLISSF